MNYLTYVIDFVFLSWLTTLTWVLITHSKSFDSLESKWEGEQEGIDEPIHFVPSPVGVRALMKQHGIAEPSEERQAQILEDNLEGGL